MPMKRLKIEPWSNRGEHDRYASQKTGGQLCLAVGLLVDNITTMNTYLEKGVNSPQHYLALAVLFLAICLQITALVLCFILITQASHKAAGYQEIDGVDTDAQGPQSLVTTNGDIPTDLRKMNTALTVITALIAVFQVVKNALGETGTTQERQSDTLDNV